jgi:hypothetical protein
MVSSTSDSSDTYAPSYSNRDPGMNVPGKVFLCRAMSQFQCSVVENARCHCFQIYMKNLPLQMVEENYSNLLVCPFFSTLETKSGTTFSVSEL